ncbi:hypothetical protein LEP1GSC024_1726 [Leptospira noguchii str. 2001034031]|uniref:Uncharacterized protein n=1 Tax=Leptospira noguchii str. 2001034031 TaxID=1193053 RepID=M6Y5T7_9LEPT|nr:hypothetical protein LEP1GSC024_1726 [Leptospira noguchii str. 2001034031]
MNSAKRFLRKRFRSFWETQCIASYGSLWETQCIASYGSLWENSMHRFLWVALGKLNASLPMGRSADR